MSLIQSIEYDGRFYTDCGREFLLAAGVPAAVVDAAEAAHLLAEVHEARRAAYVAESDPLYLEWQYDQSDEKEAEWRASVASIKARFPLPGD
ncbi:TPA: hypothetical protein NIB79_005226 [Pseudomonas aeruginosa]|nr:hypothetical protein [Pseudomonas aeruginosa]